MKAPLLISITHKTVEASTAPERGFRYIVQLHVGITVRQTRGLATMLKNRLTRERPPQGRIQDWRRGREHQIKTVEIRKLMIFMTYLINVCSDV